MAPLRSAWRRLAAAALERSRGVLKKDRRIPVPRVIFPPQLRVLKKANRLRTGIDQVREALYKTLAHDHARGVLTIANREHLLQVIDYVEPKPSDPIWRYFRRLKMFRAAVKFAGAAGSVLLGGATFLRTRKVKELAVKESAVKESTLVADLS